MDNNSLVQRWIEYSDQDLNLAKYVSENMYPKPIEAICYHCQQSAEKALKAYLIHSNIKPDRTHDLTFLRKECEKFDNGFATIALACSRLNPYSVKPHYPDELEITDSDSQLALQDAEQINKFVKSKVIKETT